jgi:ABC-type phosphate/phosphonate transport system substrate-binding protein
VATARAAGRAWSTGPVSVRIMNARMYAVTPGVEALWRALLEHVTQEADVELSYLTYPAPQPLEKLWARSDLGAVLMCGFAVALDLAPVVPLAAPIPRAPWASGRALYRTDLIVRTDSPYRTLEDTFGARAGWTVEHSHSGFNALRHHLLGYRTPQRPTLYASTVGNLVTARNVLDSVREGRIDVGPLDAYWHILIARHAPQLVAGVRVLTSTALAPAPAFVAAVGTPAPTVERLQAALTAAASREWFAPLGEQLLLDGFAAVGGDTFAPLLEWDRAARQADYPKPA